MSETIRPGGARARKERTRSDPHARALGLLAVRARSRREMRDRLARAGYESDEVEGVLDRLESVGLLDDEAFAREFAEHALTVKGSGLRAVRSSLYAKGIASATVEAVVDEMGTEDEGSRALALATSRAGRLSSLDPAAAHRRLTSFLLRRGYGYSTASDASRRALGLEAGGD